MCIRYYITDLRFQFIQHCLGICGFMINVHGFLQTKKDEVMHKICNLCLNI